MNSTSGLHMPMHLSPQRHRAPKKSTHMSTVRKSTHVSTRARTHRPSLTLTRRLDTYMLIYLHACLYAFCVLAHWCFQRVYSHVNTVVCHALTYMACLHAGLYTLTRMFAHMSASSRFCVPQDGQPSSFGHKCIDYNCCHGLSAVLAMAVPQGPRAPRLRSACTSNRRRRPAASVASKPDHTCWS